MTDEIKDTQTIVRQIRRTKRTPFLRWAAAACLASLWMTASISHAQVPQPDQPTQPKRRRPIVLSHGTACTWLSDHPIAGHFDWLSAWPIPVATAVAATQTRGGMPNPAFTDADRQKAFEQIALFFKQHL